MGLLCRALSFIVLLAVAFLQPTASATAGFDEGVAALRSGNYAKAMEEWTKAAEGGDARAQYGVGYLYQFGLGVGPDNAKAKGWYEKAAARNDPDALLALGSMYESGKAGRQDLKEAIKDYRAAAASGRSPDAEFALGRMSMRGRGMERDAKAGVEWLEKAAAHGQAAAQYMLGAAYETGAGVSADPVAAYYWYSAALAGDPAVLRQTDPSFEPKVALEALRKRMSAAQIAAAEAQIKAHPAGQPPIETPSAAGAH